MVITTVTGMPTSNLQAMGAFTSSGTFTVPGDLLFNGAITSSGKVNVGGDAQAGGALSHSGQWNVAGSTSAFNSPALTINTPTVDTASLIQQAHDDGTVFSGGAKSNYTINFNAGSNHVVCISGNLTLSGTTTVIGTGTLIIQGTLSASGTIGTNPNPVSMNLVTTSDATLSGSLNMNGALCIGGNLTKSGTTTVNGVVVVQGNFDDSGNVNITYKSPPSFIHYSGTGGSGQPLSIINFTGPIF
jgi:hypothetical protein